MQEYYIQSKTNHGEQSSVLEVWMELHQSWFRTGFPLNKPTEEEETHTLPRVNRGDALSQSSVKVRAQTMAKAQKWVCFSS